jgi:ribosomal 30S subunit maturation factor RimM
VRSGAGKRILGRLDGLGDPETAQTLREWRIAVSKAALGPLDDDELWVGELEGSTVRVGDVDVGRVITVQTTEGPDVLVIAIGEEVVLVPLVKAFFRGFDREARLLSLSADALEEG